MIRVVGVPEHFNLPWHLAIEEGAFADAGVDLTWTDVPEGTGKMCAMLRDGSVDVAVILTEGIVRDIVNGNPSKILQIYVDSPLIWGIHVSAQSRFRHVADLEGTVAAISRFGSGSHLMAYVNADKKGWNTEKLQFKTVDTVDGAVAALSAGEADYFMWERFMTKPLVDQGVFRRVGDCPTPWPCFVIVATERALEKYAQELRTMLDVINRYTQHFKEREGIDRQLASRYHQQESDIREWLALTEWSQAAPGEDVLNKVQNQLLDLGLIEKKGTFATLVKAV